MAASVSTSFASVGPSVVAQNKVVSVTRNLSYPTRPTLYPSWSNDEKPLRLFIHEECRISERFHHIDIAPPPATSVPTPTAVPTNGNAAQNSIQHTILGPSWCLAILKKLRNFGHRMFSQLTTQP
ncbi:hypothetical protein BJ165DRAFT_1408851 [Panaeolus papilionaceus]|nr:hypothetical protein BJ165DRAFT_1408851 [Panaeolus papilionaceus]